MGDLYFDRHYNKIDCLLPMKLFLNFIDEAEKNGNQHLYMLYNLQLTLEEDIDILIDHPEITLLCDGCERKLNHAASVLVDGECRRDYCFTCFIKYDPKNKPYTYFVRQNLNITCTEQAWNILSQLLLVSALQKRGLRFGFGNWGKIKNYMDYHGYNYSSKQLEKHYRKFYLTKDLKPAFSETFFDTVRLNCYTHQAVPFKEEKQVELPEITVQAYNPKRQEHLFDYNPQAENLVCDLQFLPTDTAEEVELKMLKLQEYDYLVKERQKREHFVVEHQLLEEEHFKRLLAEGIAKNTARKQVEPFSRFMNHEEAERLVGCLTLQSTLKATILELSKRRKGSSTPSFEEKYRQLSDKKEHRIIEHGLCPWDFKDLITVKEKKPNFKQPLSLEDEQAIIQKIRQLEFIDKDANITFITKAK